MNSAFSAWACTSLVASFRASDKSWGMLQRAGREGEQAGDCQQGSSQHRAPEGAPKGAAVSKPSKDFRFITNHPASHLVIHRPHSQPSLQSHQHSSVTNTLCDMVPKLTGQSWREFFSTEGRRKQHNPGRSSSGQAEHPDPMLC